MSIVLCILVVSCKKKKTKNFNFPKIKVPIFQHNVFLHRKWENGRKSDLRAPLCTHLSVCALHSSESVISQPLEILFPVLFRKDQHLPVFLEVAVVDVFAIKKVYVSCLPGQQHQGLSRAPSFPVTRSFSQWELAHLLLAHNGLANHTENHQQTQRYYSIASTSVGSSPFLSDFVLSCQIVSVFVRLCLLLSIGLAVDPHREPSTHTEVFSSGGSSVYAF